MTKYRITRTLETEIEANDEENASEIASDICSDDFGLTYRDTVEEIV